MLKRHNLFKPLTSFSLPVFVLSYRGYGKMPTANDLLHFFISEMPAPRSVIWDNLLLTGFLKDQQNESINLCRQSFLLPFFNNHVCFHRRFYYIYISTYVLIVCVCHSKGQSFPNVGIDSSNGACHPGKHCGSGLSRCCCKSESACKVRWTKHKGWYALVFFNFKIKSLSQILRIFRKSLLLLWSPGSFLS